MQSVETGALEERPLRDLISQLSRDGSLLLRQEVALAKQELSEKAGGISAAAASIAIGGLVLYAGVLALVAGLALLLALTMPAWLAAVLVGVAVAAIGAVLLHQGTKKLGDLELNPKKTTESVKHDVEMVKEAIHDRA
jgi:putative superfamily III holin-X